MQQQGVWREISVDHMFLDTKIPTKFSGFEISTSVNSTTNPILKYLGFVTNP